MAKFFFIPSDWILSDELRDWTKQKGLSDSIIEDEIESFMDYQYKTARMRPDACWRNWVKQGIRWGRIETVSTQQYRRPHEVSDEELRKDAEKSVAQMDEYRNRG